MAQSAPTLNATSTATGTGYITSITIPSGVAVGDVMILTLEGNLTAPPAPSGWTSIASFGSAGLLSVFWRRAVSGDAGTAVTLPAQSTCAQIATWTNVGGDPIASATQGGSGTALAAPTVTTADDNSVVIETWATSYTSGETPALTGPATQVQAPEANSSGYSLGSSYQDQPTAGVSTSESATTSISVSYAAITIALPPVQAPFAPTLTAPANASYEDLSGSPTFTWTYNPTQGDGSQSAIAFRRKISGASSYSYWNGGSSAWQSTIVWNSYVSQTYTFPSGTWSDGNIYNWSVATEEATESLQGPFASDFTVTAQVLPTVTITAPTGYVASVTPTVTATATPATGATILTYRLVVYTVAQTEAPGFSPGTSTGVYDSGDVAWTSNSISQQINGLSNSVTYIPYMQVSETGGELSAWTAGTGFTVAYDAPATPTITAVGGTDPSTGCPLIEVTVDAHDNLLSLLDASFEGSIGTWAGANGTFAASTDHAEDGGYSMKVTATSTGNSPTAETASNVYAVVGGATYTGMASFYAASTGRTCTVNLWFYDSSGGEVGLYTASASDVTTGWTQVVVTHAAPATAAYAALGFSIGAPNSGEIHYVDEAGIFPGTIATWSRGGLVGLTTVLITRSDGLIVRNANGAPIPTPSQTFVVDDPEVVSGTDYTYTAVISANIGPTITSGSATSSSAVVNNTQWWMLDPTNPASACAPQPTQWNPVQIQQTTAHLVLGQNVTNIVGSVTMNPDFNATFELFDNATYNAFEALLSSGKAVFISNSVTPNDSGYYLVGPQSGGLSMGIGVKAKDSQLLASTSAAPHRTVQVTAVAAPRPSV